MPIDAIIVLSVIFLLIILMSSIYAYYTKRTVQFTVKEKGTLTHGYTSDGDGRTWTDFMIYSKDNRAFKNVNCLWYWKWRSPELQSKLKIGKKYTATIYGWRVGALGWYHNIISVKEIKTKKKE